MSLESSKHSLTYFEVFDMSLIKLVPVTNKPMLLTQRQLLGLMDAGIAIQQLNRYLQGYEELFDGEHNEVEVALRKVVGQQWKEAVDYA